MRLLQGNIRAAAARTAVVIGFALSPAASAGAEDAVTILKAMSEYVGSQKSIAATFDSDVEVITSDLQKIQFASSGQVQLSRPDKMRIRRTGGYTDIELVYDGKTLTLSGNDAHAYAQEDVVGSVDEMIDRIRTKLGTAMPGTDLLLTDSYGELMADIIDAKHVGVGIIDGVECEHLAFRGPETDWQIWIEAGPRPIPRKYVITSKTMTGAPQYTVRIKDWKTDVATGADAFAFKPSADATKISVQALRDFDEVPAGVPFGGGKK